MAAWIPAAAAGATAQPPATEATSAAVAPAGAMARIGRPDEAFRGLLAVCPIGLDLDVPAALPRQANAYFSSSNAAFMDRRQASRQFLPV